MQRIMVELKTNSVRPIFGDNVAPVGFMEITGDTLQKFWTKKCRDGKELVRQQLIQDNKAQKSNQDETPEKEPETPPEKELEKPPAKKAKAE